MELILILLIVLIAVGPNVGMVNGASFNPVSLVALILVIVLILKLTGHVHF